MKFESYQSLYQSLYHVGVIFVLLWGALCFALCFYATRAYAQVPDNADDESYCSAIPDGTKIVNSEDTHPRGFSVVQNGAFEIVADICSDEASNNEDPPSFGVEIDNAAITMNNNSSLAVQGSMVGKVTIDGLDTIAISVGTTGSIIGNFISSYKVIDGDSDNNGTGAVDTVSISLAQGGTINGLIDLPDAENVNLTLATQAHILFGNENTINLAQAGNVVVNNAGTISSGTSNTLDIAQAMGVNITNSGIIEAGTSLALDLSGADDTVVLSNSGTISAGNNYAVDLRDMQANAQVSVTNSGTISATNNHALSLYDSDGLDTSKVSLTNSGTISAGTFTAIDGRGLSSGLTLINSGTISAGDNFALNMAAIGNNAVGDITLTNSGTISAGNDFAIDMQGAGNITLVNNGVISASGKNALIGRDATGLFTLSNAGTISAGQNYALDIAGVSKASIDNKAGATISAGGQYAIDAADVDVLSFTNAGTIVSVGDYALNLGTSSANVVIDNSGSIATGGSQAISAAFADGLTINNISALSQIAAGLNFAINANQVSNGFNLSNQGAISAGGQYAVDARRVTGGVSIANSGIISAQSGTAIDISEQSDSIVANAIIANSGSILSGAGTAIDAAQVSNFRLTNVGADSVVKAADSRAIDAYLVRDGLRIVNEGKISAGGDEALYLRRASGTLAITNSGTISAVGDYAIDAGWEDVAYDGTLAGGIGVRDVGEFVAQLQIRNSGSITSGGDGAINIAGTQASFINNFASDALIHSNRQYAIYADNAQGRIEIRNAGTISADDSATIYVSQANDSDTSFMLVNTGILASGNTKVLDISDTRSITISNNTQNASLAAQGATAIDAARYLDGFSLTNQGTISATNTTIDGQSGTGNFTLTNSGTISSSAANVSGDSFALRASDISGQVSLTNSGIISAGFNGAVLAENIAQSDESVRIFNSGSLLAANDYGIKVDASHDVSINNMTSGVISATQDYALSAENVTGEFTLINAGAIVSADTSISLNNATAKIALTNLGSIKASGVAALSGSNVSNHVVLSNAIGAAIEANRQTLDFAGLTSDFSLTNAGAIKSLSTDLKLAGDDYAINLNNMMGDLFVSNIETATISAETAHALRADNVDGTITLLNAANSKIVAAQNVVSLTNATGAIVVNNSGSLSASNAAGDDYVVLDVGGAASQVSITNGVTGSIDTGAQRAIKARNLVGGLAINNQGIISAAHSAVDFNGAKGGIALDNSGTINSTNTGVVATLTGHNVGALTLDNSGTISGGSSLADFACTISDCGKVSINNSGTMRLTDSEALVGYVLKVTGVAGFALNNSGTISASHKDSLNNPTNALAIDARNLTSGLNLTNLQNGTITASYNTLINADNATAGNLVFENAGTLSSGGETALTARAAPAEVRFSNIGDASTIFAANNVLDFGAASGAISFTNDGTIRNSDSTASTGFIINAQNALGGMAFTNNGTIRSVAADGAGVTLDGRLASGALSIINGENATMVAANNPLIDARLVGRAGLFSLINSGTLTTGGSYAVRASGLPSAASLINRGTIQAASTSIDLSAGGGKVTLTNEAGGLIAATATTALDLSDALSGVELNNSGVIISNGTSVNLDNAGGAININNLDGLIRSTGELAISLDGVDNAEINNSGTISAATGTAINITGTNVRLNNSGTIIGTDRAIILGGSAMLINKGSISATPTGTAIYATGTNSTITLDDGAKIIGKIEAEAGDIASDADRHMIEIKFSPHITYSLEFDEAHFDVSDDYADERPIVKGSAHAVGVAMMRAADMLAARRSRALYQAFYRPDNLPVNARLTTTAWVGDSETEKTVTDNYVLEESVSGLMQRIGLSNSKSNHTELLLAHETSAAEILPSKQKLDSVYSGLGIGTMIGNQSALRVSAYLLAGLSSNETQREVLTNEEAQGVRMISGVFDALHIDAGLGLHQTNRLGKKWFLDTRIALAVSSQTSDGYNEGDLYHFDGHDLRQAFGNMAFRLSHIRFAGSRRRPLRRAWFFELGGHARLVRDGGTHNYRFLDSDIAPDRRAVSYEDEIESASGVSAQLGFDIQLGRGSYLIGQIGSSADDDKITTNMGGLSLLLRF